MNFKIHAVCFAAHKRPKSCCPRKIFQPSFVSRIQKGRDTVLSEGYLVRSLSCTLNIPKLSALHCISGSHSRRLKYSPALFPASPETQAGASKSSKLLVNAVQAGEACTAFEANLAIRRILFRKSGGLHSLFFEGR